METAKLCGDEKVSDQVRNFFVKRIGRINRDSAVILDKRNSYGLTSFFVADALERRANGQQLAGVRDADISSMIASLQEFSSDEDFEAVRDNLRVSEALNKIGVAIPKIDSFKLRNIGSGAVVRWTYTDILGNIVKGPSRATVKYEDRTDEVNESQVTLKTQKKDLTVEIIQSVNGFTYTSRHQVHIGQDLSIIQVRMATTKGNERIKEFPYEEGGSIICNQDNKLHIQFKLDKDIEAEYAAFYLKHSEIKEFDRITAASALTYNQDQSSFRSDLDKYTGTIDMGDTEQVQPVGGKYRLIVVIADRSLNEIIQKSVATVHLSFNTEVAIKDVLDSTMPQIEEIYPTLYPPKYYNFMVDMSLFSLT